jgi:hypothetical protein
MSEKKSNPGYQPINWQNFDRRLTREELDQINSRISGIHFAKEMFAGDPFVLQLLFAAEALQREVRMLTENKPFLEIEE